MLILGINGSPNLVHENKFGIEESVCHDAAAALLVNGNLVSAMEEERLNRIKHTNKFPLMAVRACLKHHAVSIHEIDCFSFGSSEQTLDQMLSGHYENKGIAYPGAYRFVQQLLEEQFNARIDVDKIELFEHHYVHAVTAFYPSGFEDALVLTIDGSGGEYSGTVYEGNGYDLGLLRTFSIEQSLGHFYLYITFLLGFGFFDEYKVMGLAPYGNAKTYQKFFEEFYTLLPDGNYELYTKKAALLKEIIPSAALGFSQVHMDIAASLQDTLEKIVFHIVRHFKSLTGRSKLCMAGGVALNCTLNGKLLKSGLFKDVFVYPGANDSGLPVGSALAAYYKRCNNPKRSPFKNIYLGRELGYAETIVKELDQWKELIRFERVENIAKKAAELLAGDKVIGWVQGRSEFAPRALGNRSILADPRPAKNKKRINSMVKKREDFRPFAPSVLEEYEREYFELPDNASNLSYMTFILTVREQYRKELGAITHVDGTARVQTVSKKSNPEYWDLINYFREITGTAMVLNTSFNNNAEPIVDSTYDAIVSFLTTRLDFLIIGNYLIEKSEFFTDNLEQLHVSLPRHIALKRQDKGS
ncbi:MAG: carbamoyltransferase C-terminal domain-containing protein, partial [Chitinophaga rupis]